MEALIKTNERLDDLQLNNLKIIQDPSGYCFTSDSVILANFVKLKPNSKVVELCSGSGVIGLLINAKNNVKKITMVEIQKTLADMSERSIKLNELSNKIEVINSNLINISNEIGKDIYEAVVCNPPYQKQNTISKYNENSIINIAKHEILINLEQIISESAKLLKFGGDLYICNREDRLVDLLSLMRKYNIEPKKLKILKSNSGSSNVFIKGTKGGKSGIKIDIIN